MSTKKLFDGSILWILNLVILTGWISLEVFNAITTNQALGNLFPAMTGIRFLTIVFITFDIAGLARVFTSNVDANGKQISEPIIIMVLFAIWVLVAMINALLTYADLAVRMEAHAPVVPSTMRNIIPYIPVVIALSVLSMRTMLMYAAARMLDSYVHGGRARGTAIGSAVSTAVGVNRRSTSQGWSQPPVRHIPPMPMEEIEDDFIDVLEREHGPTNNRPRHHSMGKGRKG